MVRAAVGLHEFDIPPAVGRIHAQRVDLPPANGAFDRRAQRRVEFELAVPVARPGGQQQNAASLALDEHQLQSVKPVAAVVFVGYVVEAVVPEGGEAALLVFAGEHEDNILARGFDVAQQCRLEAGRGSWRASLATARCAAVVKS